MKRAEKNMKQRFSNFPISIVAILKIGFAVAGFCLWGWAFIAAVAGLYIGFAIVKGVLSCLFSLALLIAFTIILAALIF